MNVFDLYSNVLIGILTEWCDIICVGKFDAAVCNQKARNLLLKYFSSNEFVHPVDRIEFYIWLNARSVKIRNLRESALLLSKENEIILTQILNIILTIRVHGGTEFVSK